MTLAEFKVWFYAFNEGLDCARSGDDAIGRIAEMVDEIDDWDEVMADPDAVMSSPEAQAMNGDTAPSLSQPIHASPMPQFTAVDANVREQAKMAARPGIGLTREGTPTGRTNEGIDIVGIPQFTGVSG